VVIERKHEAKALLVVQVNSVLGVDVPLQEVDEVVDVALQLLLIDVLNREVAALDLFLEA
jgi:hypothetical protein